MLATGLVRPLTTPLTAPFSGTPCVGYRYRMYFIPRRIVSMNVEPGSRKGEMVPVCWGYASRPFALDRPSRRMRVLAIPRFDCPATGLGDEALPRAREFLRTTTFEPMSAQPLRAFATAFEQFEGTLTDEDDEARRD
jgi:hypothetical protein